jgi:hypothetical protein
LARNKQQNGKNRMVLPFCCTQEQCGGLAPFIFIADAYRYLFRLLLLKQATSLFWIKHNTG